MKKRRNEKELGPKISVVMPILNMDQYLEEAIQSVLKQTYQNFEIIIQDGLSKDDSVRIIKKYAKKYPQKIRWESKKDGGQTDAINKGFKKAKGDLFLYLNGDDLLDKNAFELVADAYKENPERIWFTGFGNIIDADGRQISHWVTIYKNSLIKLNKKSLLLSVNYITQPATFISKKAFVKYGPFNGIGKIILEYDLWLKFAVQEMPVVILANLASFRLTENNFSSTSFKRILQRDQELVTQYTNNPVILLIHWLNNFGRIALIRRS